MNINLSHHKHLLFYTQKEFYFNKLQKIQFILKD